MFSRERPKGSHASCPKSVSSLAGPYAGRILHCGRKVPIARTESPLLIPSEGTRSRCDRLDVLVVPIRFSQPSFMSDRPSPITHDMPPRSFRTLLPIEQPRIENIQMVFPRSLVLPPPNERALSKSLKIGGAAKAALDCARQATVFHLNDPSKLACFPSLGRAPMLV
jgi:hypothetical protein